jgi:hypothetical protein
LLGDSREFTVAVIEPVNDKHLGMKNVVPNEKVIYIGLDDRDEAYYVCGLLSSSKYRHAIHGFMVNTQIGPGIIDKLYLPRFDKRNALHLKLSHLCLDGHRKRNYPKSIGKLDRIVDDLLKSRQT